MGKIENRQHLLESLIELKYSNMARYLVIPSYGYERYKLSAVYLSQVYTSKFASKYADWLDTAKLRRIDIKPDNGVRNFIAKELKTKRKNTKKRREVAIEIVLKDYSLKGN